MGAPRNFDLTANWVLEMDGIERSRFSKVTIPEEAVTDIVIKQSAETFPNRMPGEYTPVDVAVEGPTWSDDTVQKLWERTINIINGGGPVGEDLYFDADLIQLDRDKVTPKKKFRLHHCYCGGRGYGDFDAETDAPRKESFILRPKRIEPIQLT
jgi:hypothetical protein